MFGHGRMMYGLLLGNIFPLSFTYVIGTTFSMLFVVVYYRATTEKKYALKCAGVVALFVVFLTAYSVLGRLGATNQSSDSVSETVGYVAASVSVILYASPFETILIVIRTKSVTSIPILMCTAGLVNNVLWTIYGFATNDLVVIIPNVICVTCGTVQVIVYVIYKPRSPKVDLPSSTEFAASDATAPVFQAIQTPRDGDRNC